MKKGLLITVIALVVAIIVAGFAGFNKFVETSDNLETLHNQVEHSEALIQVKLQERFDVVPNLVEILKDSANHEKEILTAIAEARTEYNKAVKAGDTAGMLEANESINTVLSRIEENYPEIAALEMYKDFNDNYLSLEAAVTEARNNHTAAVTNYNNALDMFWNGIVANMKGMRPEGYFEASAKAEQGVSINITD